MVRYATLHLPPSFRLYDFTGNIDPFTDTPEYFPPSDTVPNQQINPPEEPPDEDALTDFDICEDHCLERYAKKHNPS